MRLIWLSEGPETRTGFGNVTRYVCNGLSHVGFEVHILAWESYWRTVMWRRCYVHSARYPGLGSTVLPFYLASIQPNFMITFGDPWWFKAIVRQNINEQMRAISCKWIMYYPLDGALPNGLLPQDWTETMKIPDLAVACSDYGAEVSRRCGIDAKQIPHGVDTSLFKPPESKELAKEKMGYQRKFVVLSDSRNQPRKLLPRLLAAFAKFAKGKNDVVLHLHTDPDDPLAKLIGLDLRKFIRDLDIDGKVVFTKGYTYDKGIALEKLAEIYKSADVHVLSSAGEGFGLPTLQASASGVVPFAPDFSANRELIKGHGELIRVERFVEGTFGFLRALMDVDDCARRLTTYYENPSLLREVGEQARAFALEYDWSKIVEQWAKFLAETDAKNQLMPDKAMPEIVGRRTDLLLPQRKPVLFRHSFQ